jgi:hypothetical protein
VVILVPASQAEVARLIQATFELEHFVAFAYSTVDTEHDFRLTGNRIILNPPAVRNTDSSAVRTILAHELTHIATRPASGPFVPVFVDEGLAEYVAYKGSPASLSFISSEVAAGSFDGLLPADYQFTTGSGTDIYRAYQKAESAVKFFVDRWGIAKFDRFYRLLDGERVAPGTTRYHVSSALRKTVGMGYGGFQKAWASSMGR